MTQTPLLKVLWIEDQPEENAGFELECKIKGFKLVNARNAEDGIDLLKKNPESFAAIILDALGHKKTSLEGLGTSGLHHSLREIRAILPDIPKLIFTGQKEFIGNNDFQENVDVPVFQKLSKNDKLFTELRKQIEGRPDAELRRRYPDICNLCDDEFLPAEKWSETLFPALKEAHEGIHNPDRFAGLRKTLDAALRNLATNGITPLFVDRHDSIIQEHYLRFLSGSSVKALSQDTIHFIPRAALLDETDKARIKLVKILTSSELHDHNLHRTVADLSCAVFTLVSLLPSLKALLKQTPEWKLIDFSQAEYEIPGQIKPNRKGVHFQSFIGKDGKIILSQDFIAKNSLQPEDLIWVKCRYHERDYHEAIDVRPMD
jgi:hypothetical protein